MAIASSFMLSVSIGCMIWLALHFREERALISHRISNTSTKLSPAPGALTIESLFPTANRKKISLKTLKYDRVARALFMAGIKNEGALLWFHRIQRGLVVLPILLMLLYVISGSFTTTKAFGALLLTVSAMIVIQLFLRIARERRQKMILRQLPQFLDLIVVGAEAGLSFMSALERILNELSPRDPLTQELYLLHHEIMSGLSMADAAKRFADRCDIPDLSLFLGSVVQSDQIGVSLVGTLRTQAAEVRDKYRQRVRLRAMKIPIKILFPLLPIFMAFMLLNVSIIFFQLGQALNGGPSIDKASYEQLRKG